MSRQLFSVLVGMIWRAPRLWNTSRKKATPTVGNTFQTENYSINYQHLKTYHYEDEQKSTEEQRTEIRKENAVKVTALAVIPKPIMLLTPQDVPTATSDGPPSKRQPFPPLRKKHRSRSRSRHRLQRPQPKQTLTSPPYTQARTTTARRSMTHHCRNLRKAFGKWESCRPLRYAHARKAVMKSYTVNAVTVPHCLQGKDHKGDHI